MLCLFRLAPPAHGIDVHGHAAPVDTGSTAQRYAVRGSRVKPEDLGRTRADGCVQTPLAEPAASGR